MYNHVKVGDRVKVKNVPRNTDNEFLFGREQFVSKTATVIKVQDSVTYMGKITNFDVVIVVFEDKEIQKDNIFWWRSDDLEVENTVTAPEVGTVIVVTTDRYLPGLAPNSTKIITGLIDPNDPLCVAVTVFSKEFNTDFEIPLTKEDYYFV